MKHFLNNKWFYILSITTVSLIITITFQFNIVKNRLVHYWEGNIGKTVFYGKYEQDNDAQNGKEQIEWIVLDKKDKKLLLLSKKSILVSKNTSDKHGWKNSVLRKKLNDSFYNKAFSAKEKFNIKKNSSISYGQSVTDSVFVLSKAEVEKYLHIEGVESTHITEYVRNNYEQHLDKIDADYEIWLRDDHDIEEYVNGYSEVFYCGHYNVIDSSYIAAVRPAMWVDISGI